MKYILYTLLALFSVLISPRISLAHSGRTDSSGCHNCYTSYCYGEYHCHNGGYTPSYYPTYVQTPQAPDIKASFTFKPNPDGKTFDVDMEWSNVINTGFSIALQKYAGGDPGPLTDTLVNKWTFKNVLPGTYYANMKVGINYVWSTVTYWRVDVPKWYSLQTPTPVPPAVTAPVDTTTGGDLLAGGLAFLVGLGFLGFLTWLGFKIIIWLFNYAKENDWVYGAVFWILLIGGVLLVSVFTKKTESTSDPGGYECNCSKTCPNMTCDEAYFQLESCGCTVRDGDGDGVPCEAQCN